MRLFHVALASDWEDARAAGAYAVSTRGRTLAEEGFVHASRGDQWQAVRRRHYADVTEPLVLLVVDSTLLDVPVVEEAVPGSDETHPHVYGPIATSAVVSVIPLAGEVPAPAAGGVGPETASTPSASPSPSFSRLFLDEVFFRLLLAAVVLAAVVLGALVGDRVAPGWGALVGTVVGAAVCLPFVVGFARRRDRRLAPPGRPRPPG